jgi:hypothetical protein
MKMREVKLIGRLNKKKLLVIDSGRLIFQIKCKVFENY